jgi:hypothetical protein
MTTQLCDNCNASGLPILPLRYAPVPTTLSPALPGWASGQRVTSVKLGSEFHYALRGLRAGYIYVFYAKNQFGANQWDCWVVTADGILVKQPNPQMAADAPPLTLQCSRKGHSNTRLHHLVIERPDKCGPSWIAFSQHKWSDDTLTAYTSNMKLRDARMQSFNPAEMAQGAKHSHGTPATVAALEQVLDYAVAPPEVALPYRLTVPVFSQEDGRFDPSALRRVSTLYPWLGRQGQAQADVAAMLQRAQKLDGTHNTPQLLALWDAVGTTHELSGYCNDVAGRLAQYGSERELQIACSNYLKELQTASASAAQNDAQQQHALSFSVTSQRQQGTGKAMNKLAAEHPGDPRYAEAAQLQTQWEASNAPSYYSQRLYTALQHYHDKPWRKNVDQLKQEVASYLKSRDPNFQKHVAEVRLHAWDRFEKYIDTQGALQTFKGNWDALQSNAAKLMDERKRAVNPC